MLLFHLNLPFKAFTTDAGVDVLSFGGTKNGMMFGEAICFLRPGLSADFKYIQETGDATCFKNEIYFSPVYCIFPQ